MKKNSHYEFYYKKKLTKDIPIGHNIVIKETNMKKKRWIEPKLIILARTTTEEYILEQCKAVHGPGSTSPSGGYTGQNCKAHPKNPGVCSGCLAEGGGSS